MPKIRQVFLIDLEVKNIIKNIALKEKKFQGEVIRELINRSLEKQPKFS